MELREQIEQSEASVVADKLRGSKAFEYHVAMDEPLTYDTGRQAGWDEAKVDRFNAAVKFEAGNRGTKGGIVGAVKEVFDVEDEDGVHTIRGRKE